MKVNYAALRRLKLLQDDEIIDLCEDEAYGDVFIVYADRTVQDKCVEVYAVVFDIELENLEFDPRHYRRLPPGRNAAEHTSIDNTSGFKYNCNNRCRKQRRLSIVLTENDRRAL